MNNYRADLHIHSVLSPCGDLDMSPSKIIETAAANGLDIIAVTDHNHTGHARLTRQLGEAKGIWVVYGAEVTTREEVHCLTFFDTDDQLASFQEYLEVQLPRVMNDAELLGHQVIVDAEERIREEVAHSLYPGLEQGVDEVAEAVRSLGGLFVPAHVDRPRNGIYAQLGFFPGGLQPDAVEIFRKSTRTSALEKHPELQQYQLLKSSDAHFTNDIGRCTSTLVMANRSFSELSMAFRGEQGRRISND